MQSQTPSEAVKKPRTTPHSVRTTESLWLSAERRAQGEGVKVGFVVSELLEGYSKGMLTLPPLSGKSTAKREAGHSIRTTNTLWTAAKRAASAEGLNMNEVIERILSGYARGLMDLPKVTKSFVATTAKSKG